MTMQQHQTSQSDIDIRRPGGVVIWALIIWIGALTMIFLLLQSPADWTVWFDAQWPQVVDLRSALRSLFYRDYAF